MIDWEDNQFGSSLTGRAFGGFVLFDIDWQDGAFRVTIRGVRTFQSPVQHKETEIAKQWCYRFVELYTTKAKKS